MPSMKEIYGAHADMYDRLVKAEDHQGNLPRFLSNRVDWKDKVVYEAGIGTGRVTGMYLAEARRCFGFDKEAHMLERCARNLAAFADKLQLDLGSNEDLPRVNEPADILIEGWAFGHTMADSYPEVVETFDSMLERMEEILKPDGTIIVIETLGTNVDTPTVKNPALRAFYEHMEKTLGFESYEISTDYLFEDHRQAAKVCGFFFGEEMGAHIQESKLSTIPEFTGIWAKELGRE